MQTITRRERRVWFPIDERGEPDDKNPGDGFGGFIHNLETLIYNFVTSDGKLPNLDGSNILEGSAAMDKVKENKIGKDWQKTIDLIYREFKMPIEKGGCDENWENLEEKLLLLEEPDFCLIGQFWRQLYGNVERKEEREIEIKEMEGKRKIDKIYLQIDEFIRKKFSYKHIIKIMNDIQIQKKLPKQNKERKFIKNPPKTPPSRNKPRIYQEFPRRSQK